MPRLRHRLIQFPIIGAAVLAALVLAAHAFAADTVKSAADLHTFTNTDGASFKAQITGVTGDQVFLKREDGQVFRPKIAIFSMDDQNFIQLWAIKHATTNGDKIFSFHAISVKSDESSRVTSSAASNVPYSSYNNNPNLSVTTQVVLNTWEENYKLEVKNLTAVNWSGLHFRYIIFAPEDNSSRVPRKSKGRVGLPGSFDVDKYPDNQSKTFSLDKVDMQETRIVTNGVYDQPIKATADNTMGLWVRVYDDAENLIQEWASDPGVLKNEHWTFPATAAKSVTPALAPTTVGSTVPSTSPPASTAAQPETSK